MDFAKEADRKQKNPATVKGCSMQDSAAPIGQESYCKHFQRLNLKCNKYDRLSENTCVFVEEGVTEAVSDTSG